MGCPRILVLRGGAIGDFVLTLPALALLRERWPASHIELVGYPHIAHLAKLGGLVNEVRSLDAARIAALFSWKPAIPGDLAEYLSSFDVVISYLYDPDGTVQENMKAAGVRHLIYGNPKGDGGHAADFLARPLVALAIYPAGVVVPELVVPEECRRAGANRLSAYGPHPAVLHPGSGGRGKRWPLSCFLALAERLRGERQMTPLLMLGEADGDIKDVLNAQGVVWPVLSGLSLAEVAGILCSAELYVGNDSGVTHLAAAVGVRTVALFGPSDPKVWGPRGRQVTVCCPGGFDGAGGAASDVSTVWMSL